MLITIAEILPRSELDEILDALGRIRFEDGRSSAGAAARLVKDNTQAADGITLKLLRERVSRALLAHPVFDLAVRPRALSPLLFSRYALDWSWPAAEIVVSHCPPLRWRWCTR